jgi:hypothetical protein
MTTEGRRDEGQALWTRRGAPAALGWDQLDGGMQLAIADAPQATNSVGQFEFPAFLVRSLPMAVSKERKLDKSGLRVAARCYESALPAHSTARVPTPGSAPHAYDVRLPRRADR